MRTSSMICNRGSVRAARRGRSKTHEMIESLEARRLLATFDGTVGNDTISMGVNGSNTIVFINGVSHSTSDLTVVINGLAGQDSLSVVTTRSGSTVTFNGGPENDTVTNIGSDLDATFLGTFQFNGDDGIDRFTADNSGDSTTAATIDIEGDAIVKDGSILCHYATVENVSFSDSGGSNRVDFINLQNGSTVDVANVTINGNGGNDVIANYRTIA